MSSQTSSAAMSGDPRVHTPEGGPARGRALELEGYRGIAALLTVVFHVMQYVLPAEDAHRGPVVAVLVKFQVVDIMFVMSAYLLSLSYARSILDGAPIQTARGFLFRRAVRIVPLYWFVVILVWTIRNPSLPGDWRDLIEHLTFTQVFDRQRIFYTIGQGWSMSLEVMFYLFLVLTAPAVAWATRRIVSRRRRAMLLIAGCIVLAVLPLLWNLMAFSLLHVPYNNWPIYFGPQARFGAFALGMLIAVVHAARRGQPVLHGPAPTLARLTALLVAVAATYAVRPSTVWEPVYHDLMGVAWAVLVASTVLGAPHQAWSRWLSVPVLSWFGMISYSVYMWHESLMLLLHHLGLIDREPGHLWWSMPVVLLVSIAVGALSYHLIEVPTGRLRLLQNRDGTRREYYPDLVDHH